uniref:Uncharacterized protein n=1 Tax=Seriola dumerili TaxID=41447 RepID=A0A3B4UFB3_SERDU
VFAIQPVCFVSGDEELRAINFTTLLTWSCVFEDKVFIIKLPAVDGLATGAIVVGEVASLTHELRDDPVEAAAFVAKAFLISRATCRRKHPPHPQYRLYTPIQKLGSKTVC